MAGKTFAVWLRCSALALLLAFASAPIQAAVDIQPLFKDLCDYHVLDSDTCAAKTLVDCLVKTGGHMDSLLKCAGDYDPKAKKFIDIFFAAKKPDVVKFIELAGPIVACQGATAILPPGPPKEILCGDLLAPIVKLGAGTAAQIYQAVADKNWPKLIYLAGPGLGCEALDLVGSVPGKDLLCGTVAKVIEEAVKIAKDAAKAGKAVGEFLLDTGTDIVNGVGGAVEGACESIGLCDDDEGKKLMSGSQYYTYRLFPLIHDRVLARLANGQQNLGHDSASLLACMKYYQYDLYAQHPMFKQLAPKVKKGCEDLGARLHKEADALVVLFAAASKPYFEVSVRPAIPAMAVKNHGTNAVASLRKTVTAQCVTQVRTQLPIPEPSKPGTTAWDHVCKQVGDLFQSAYLAEEKKLAAALLQTGCKKQQKSVYVDYELVCSSYEGFAACQTAYTAKLPCSLDTKKADTALADKILQQLGTKRCKIEDEVKSVPCVNKYGIQGSCPQPEKNIACSRPWKVEKCKALLATLGAGHPNSTVHCTDDPAGLAAFAKLEGQASAIINKLNGGGWVIGTKAGLGDAKAKASAGTGSCKTTWDPLTLTCPGGENLAHPEISLPACAADPNQDGADAPCLVGTLMMPSAPAVVPGGAYQGPMQGAKPKPPASLPPPMSAPPALSPPPMLAPGADVTAPPPGIAPAPLPGSPGRRATPAVITPPPTLAPPTDAVPMAPAAGVPGCTPAHGSPGQYACATREAYAACERMRASGASGIRTCQASGGRLAQ